MERERKGSVKRGQKKRGQKENRKGSGRRGKLGRKEGVEKRERSRMSEGRKKKKG